MKINYKDFIWIGLLLWATFAHGQILDDSTQELYSYKTVRYRLEENMVTNHGAFRGDTTLNNLSQKCDFLYQPSGMYQNLGVFGTSARPLFYRLPQAVGLRNGMTAFDYLIPSGQEIKYFNSLSPYTEARYTQGARQRASLQVTMAQNILPRWNIAAHYQRFTALRTINVTQSEERQADHHSAYVSSHFSDSLGYYRAWGHYQHMNHQQYETGGIKWENGRPSYRDSLFSNADIYPAMLNSNARTRDLRNNWYFSQVFNPFRHGFYLRTSHYRNKQTNRYTDPQPNLDFYGQANLYFQRNKTTSQADTLYSDRVFRLWENTAFIGYQDSSFDANLYVKRRDILFYANLFTFNRNRTEYVYGGQFTGWLGPGKTTLKGEWISPKEYDLQGHWKWGGLLAEARWFVFKPSLVQTEFVSKNLLYYTHFDPSKSLHIAVSQSAAYRGWKASVGFEHFSVWQGVAFGPDYQPFQANDQAVMQLAKISIHGRIGQLFHTENQLIRVFQSGSRIAQMPTYVYHSAHWFDIVRKKKGYGFQLGCNIDWRYDWPSENYNPVNGQWFLQSQTTIPPYTLVDVFAHVLVSRARFYFKVHNTLQGLGSPGYFAAPNYQAQRRLFEIGLIWTFFD